MKDPVANALADRRKGIINITIKLKPEDAGLAPEGEEHADEAQDKELIKEMVPGAEEPAVAEAAEEEELDPEMLAVMRGPGTDEQIEEEFKDRAPRSLGERVRSGMVKPKK